MQNYSDEKYPLQKETYTIIGLCFEVHKILGKGLLEIVYKDALEVEFKINNIPYEREKIYPVIYKGIELRHKFQADFIVYDKVILEVKSCKTLIDDHYSQTINYLGISNNYLGISKCAVGLVANFGESSLKTKRIVL